MELCDTRFHIRNVCLCAGPRRFEFCCEHETRYIKKCIVFVENIKYHLPVGVVLETALIKKG